LLCRLLTVVCACAAIGLKSASASSIQAATQLDLVHFLISPEFFVPWHRPDRIGVPGSWLEGPAALA
jgi:hypothetical protein